MRFKCLFLFICLFLCFGQWGIAEINSNELFIMNCKKYNSEITAYKTQVRFEFLLNGKKELVTYNVDVVKPQRYQVIQHAFENNKWDKWVSINDEHYYFYGHNEVVLKNPFPDDVNNKSRTNKSLSIDKYLRLLELKPKVILHKDGLAFIRYAVLERLEDFPVIIGDLTYNINVIIDDKTYLINEVNIKGEGVLGDGRSMRFDWTQKFSDYNGEIEIEEPTVTKKSEGIKPHFLPMDE